MSNIFIGLDISKGTTEFCAKIDDGRILLEGTFDDTPQGHERMQSDITKLVKEHKVAGIKICMESTGGLERNWYRSLKIFSEKGSVPTGVCLINPLLINGFTKEKLHRSTTDVSAARDIAEYLRLGRPMPKPHPDEMLLDGAISLYRTITNAVDRCSKMKNELQSFLPQVHPNLGKYTRSSIPEWVLLFLERYPTVSSLARIRPMSLAKVPGITIERAKELVNAAKVSIAAFRDSMTGITVKFLAQEIMSLERQIKELKSALTSHVDKNALVQRLSTISGVAEWTAVGLIVEYGDIRRFARAEDTVAYAGLDPAYYQSGDGVKRARISRRGKSSIRRLLYMPAQTAAMYNPAIKEFYQRLRAKGKTHRDAITACMGKLLRICFAVWVSGKDFDAKYVDKKKKHADEQKNQAPGKKNYHDPAWDADAPVSRREAKRRCEIKGKSGSHHGSVTRSTPQVRRSENQKNGKLKTYHTTHEEACTNTSQALP